MTINQVSNLSSQQILTSQLATEQSKLSTLAQQLATGKKYTDLTDYTPSDALNLINLQSSATQSNAYVDVMTTVQSRLSGYDTTMTDLESIVSQAQTLAAGNPNYNASTAGSLQSEATNFLKSVTVDLNQQIGGRYIYSGSRYTTPPVTDLSTLTGSASTTVYGDNASLPSYDSQYSATAITTTTSGQTVTVGGAAAANESASVTVNGKTYTYAVAATDTPTSIAAGLATLVVADIPGTTATNGVLTVGATGTIDNATSANTNTGAYAQDTASIGASYTIQYGVTADNPAFQQLIQGLRYLSQAGASTDNTTYQANMTQAETLLTSALNGITGLHAAVAGNINTLTQQTAAALPIRWMTFSRSI
jgi:flagellar hook-associated protein 3 FlgL